MPCRKAVHRKYSRNNEKVKEKTDTLTKQRKQTNERPIKGIARQST